MKKPKLVAISFAIIAFALTGCEYDQATATLSAKILGEYKFNPAIGQTQSTVEYETQVKIIQSNTTVGAKISDKLVSTEGSPFVGSGPQLGVYWTQQVNRSLNTTGSVEHNLSTGVTTVKATVEFKISTKP